jgi:predicted MPP superfamily phosphohydrolase
MGRGRHYHRWRRWADRIQGSLYGSGWAASIAYALGLQGRLKVDRRTFALRLNPPGPPLRVAFVSDLHAGPLTDPRLLRAAIGRIADAAPDLLLLGGDYVSLDHRHVLELTRLLGALRPRLGVFGVLGNHDLWQDDVAISRALGEAGVRLLINEEHRLPEPFPRVVVYGMDEPGTGDPRAPSAPLHDDDIRLVLMHSPLGLRYLEQAPFHVAFCGHTHGGQVALPSGIPLVLPRGSGGRRYGRGGVFPVSGGQLLVSRGLGFSDLPLRLFATSELHLCTIERKGGASS